MIMTQSHLLEPQSYHGMEPVPRILADLVLLPVIFVMLASYLSFVNY